MSSPSTPPIARLTTPPGSGFYFLVQSAKMSASLLRVAARGPSSLLRANLVAARPQPMAARAGLAVPTNSFSTSARLSSGAHEETFEEFTAR